MPLWVEMHDTESTVTSRFVRVVLAMSTVSNCLYLSFILRMAPFQSLPPTATQPTTARSIWRCTTFTLWTKQHNWRNHSIEIFQMHLQWHMTVRQDMVVFLWNFAQAICNDLRFWFPISLSSCQRSTCPDTYVSMRVATLLLKNRLPPHGTYHTVRRWSVWFAFNFKPMPLKAMGLQELGLELPRILGSNVNRALCHLGSKDLARSMSLNISSPNQDAAPNCHI